MSRFSAKIAVTLAAALLAGAALASTANAKPLGGGLGSIKPGIGSGFKPVTIKPPVFKPGVLKPLPGKIKLPPGGFKPLPPGGGPKPKPPHAGGHGKFWVIGGLTILATEYGGCGYEYYKWKSTGTSYWYERYVDCREG